MVFCLDADAPGQAATGKYRTEYEGRGLKVSIRTPAKGKDWNEYLQQRGPPQESLQMKSQEEICAKQKEDERERAQRKGHRQDAPAWMNM